MFPTVSSTTISLFSLSTLAFLSLICSTTAQSSCNADNCLRSAKRSSAQIAPFCSSYLSTAPASTATLPAFATAACSQVPSRISSACQCLISSTPVTSTPTSILTPSPTARPYAQVAHQTPCCLCCAFHGYSLVGAASTYTQTQASEICKQRCTATDGCQTVYVENVNNEGDYSWYCVYKDGGYDQADTDCAGSGSGTCVELVVWGK